MLFDPTFKRPYAGIHASTFADATADFVTLGDISQDLGLALNGVTWHPQLGEVVFGLGAHQINGVNVLGAIDDPNRTIARIGDDTTTIASGNVTVQSEAEMKKLEIILPELDVGFDIDSETGLDGGL